MRYAGWRAMDKAGWKELDEFLFARAMEHDSQALLFRLACEYLISERVVRPGVVWLLEHVAIGARAGTAGDLAAAGTVGSDGPGAIGA